MIRKHASRAALVATLVAGWGGVASGQTAQPPEQMHPTADPTNASAHPVTKGAPVTEGERFEHERSAMKGEVQKAMTKADDEMRALGKSEFTDSGDKKRRDQHEEKRLSDLRARLSDDLSKLEKATVDDWTRLRPAIQHNLDAMQWESRRVETIVRPSLPAK